MSKGADPFICQNKGQSIFHICCYLGHFDCLLIVLNFLWHSQRVKLADVGRRLINQFKIKRTDVRNGELLTSKRHLPEEKLRFKDFQTQILNTNKEFLEGLLDISEKAATTQDHDQKTPIHFAAMNKYTKCLKTMRLLMLPNIEIEGFT